ncbi:hypothetical protein AWB70_04717 [Caballeronia cordobensis]|uniref:Uncharacterized protein n=2 Tax=Caballeronia cordobensis TaxID=1353886 RepID=A0A158IF83_CABCO|nr:hypothetical protein AWB70_04717 [Caballeronia cordobensis]
MSVSLLSGCDKPSSPASSPSPSASTPAAPNSAIQERKIALLREISGVWNSSAPVGLTTIHFADNRLQILQGDTPLAVTLGDVDPDAETVNINTRSGGKDEILTLRKVWNSDHTAYNLSLIGSDGMQESLGFVRRISNDDLNRIARLSVVKTPAPPPSQPVESTPVATSANRGVIDMWLSGIDMNMRSCPGSTCSAVVIVPKDSKISADTSTIRNVTESSGTNTPWVRVTYEGAYCMPAELDQQIGCMPSHNTEAPVTGWMNYTRLLSAPRVQQ